MADHHGMGSTDGNRRLHLLHLGPEAPSARFPAHIKPSATLSLGPADNCTHYFLVLRKDKLPSKASGMTDAFLEAEKSKVEGLHLVMAFLLVGTLKHPEVGRASHGWSRRNSQGNASI
ncbi:uncharacterized protein LOC124901993 isoform X2 [Homo sapiens]|uniref:uncharacterized protein LOC124901993 isoform X2 n=1 Tax=Homo sapiens TaxID=9606 RepID=UPI001FB145A4|nr:uncharacterized protein LOC124901993 isoform X2 [Homo sapiens]